MRGIQKDTERANQWEAAASFLDCDSNSVDLDAILSNFFSRDFNIRANYHGPTWEEYNKSKDEVNNKEMRIYKCSNHMQLVNCTWTYQEQLPTLNL